MIKIISLQFLLLILSVNIVLGQTKENSNSIGKHIYFKAKNGIVNEDTKLWIKYVLKHNDDIEFKLLKENRDQLGWMHSKYEQFYKGVKVEDGVFIVHSKEGKIISGNTEFYDIRSKDVSTSIAKNEVRKIIANLKGKEINYSSEELEPTYLCLFQDEENYKLAYKVDVFSMDPMVREFIYLEANTGEIVKSINRMHEVDSVGTAQTLYNGSKSITTNWDGTVFRLEEFGRGGGIKTRNLNSTLNLNAATDFTDADNFWNTTTNSDNAAYDVHYAAEGCYDYYFNIFGRDSYDGLGTIIKSYAHYGNNVINAGWQVGSLFLGDGDGFFFTPFTSTVIIGHEFSHGVIESSANLVYVGESGALNESFADIFGVAIDFYKNPATANFLIGEEISILGAFRDMSNPKSTSCPDTRYGQYWATDVHINSGPSNYWFYLLANGGSGTNDLNDSYSVPGIGLDKASAIAYRNLTVYLTPNSDYDDARQYSIQAAADLYGACSPEVEATIKAWYAVGVGADYADPPQNLDFTSDVSLSFYNPQVVNFTNLSPNTGSTYTWDFGDGNSGTGYSQTHTYNGYGLYSITLSGSSVGPCENSLTKQYLIYISTGQDH